MTLRCATTAFILATSLASVAVAQQPPKPAAPAASNAPAPAKPAAAPAASNAPAPAKPAATPAKPAATAAAPAPGGGDVQPTLLGQYADWGAYTASPGGNKVCFALAKPKTTTLEPAGRTRGPSYLFVSTRPTDKVKNEVSVIIGYPFKSTSDATAEIGPAKFAMYTQNDGAWIKNVAEEARMVDAMRKGADLTVKGTSGRGTQSTDQYSLKGLAQALDKIEQECK
jgi:Invasion associated locus B (IalB) protein